MRIFHIRPLLSWMRAKIVGEGKEWRYYLAAYLGTLAYLVVTNIPGAGSVLGSWDLLNALALTVMYSVTFGFRKRWYGNPGLRRLPVEIFRYALWFLGVFMPLSVAGVHLLMRFTPCWTFAAQLLMSAVTTMMGRRVTPWIFSKN